MEAAVSGSAEIFRMKKATVSTAVWTPLYKRAQCHGRVNHAEKVCKTTLERTREEEELGLGSKGWWEVLQLVDECNGLVSAFLHVCGDVFIGADRGTGSHEPVGSMLDI
jgi:hypothetical protein